MRLPLAVEEEAAERTAAEGADGADHHHETESKANVVHVVVRGDFGHAGGAEGDKSAREETIEHGKGNHGVERSHDDPGKCEDAGQKGHCAEHVEGAKVVSQSAGANAADHGAGVADGHEDVGHAVLPVVLGEQGDEVEGNEESAKDEEQRDAQGDELGLHDRLEILGLASVSTDLAIGRGGTIGVARVAVLVVVVVVIVVFHVLALVLVHEAKDVPRSKFLAARSLLDQEGGYEERNQGDQANTLQSTLHAKGLVKLVDYHGPKYSTD